MKFFYLELNSAQSFRKPSPLERQLPIRPCGKGYIYSCYHIPSSGIDDSRIDANATAGELVVTSKPQTIHDISTKRSTAGITSGLGRNGLNIEPPSAELPDASTGYSDAGSDFDMRFNSLWAMSSYRCYFYIYHSC